ncbi:hypothetical protein ACJJIW_15625 [Microbulbifer sp. JMSA004]|uniref:hypothetical protein n=1 Tax=Microbulbifer sp. JMSA004 TaxID=3243370 RepID=UPI004039E9B6
MIRIIRQKEAPFLFLIVLASFGWAANHLASRTLNQPIITYTEYTEDCRPEKEGRDDSYGANITYTEDCRPEKKGRDDSDGAKEKIWDFCDDNKTKSDGIRKHSNKDDDIIHKFQITNISKVNWVKDVKFVIKSRGGYDIKSWTEAPDQHTNLNEKNVSYCTVDYWESATVTLNPTAKYIVKVRTNSAPKDKKDSSYQLLLTVKESSGPIYLRTPNWETGLITHEGSIIIFFLIAIVIVVFFYLFVLFKNGNEKGNG